MALQCPYTKSDTGKLEAKRPFRRPRRRWKDKIRRDVRKVYGRDEKWLDAR